MPRETRHIYQPLPEAAINAFRARVEILTKEKSELEKLIVAAIADEATIDEPTPAPIRRAYHRAQAKQLHWMQRPENAELRARTIKRAQAARRKSMKAKKAK